MIAQTPNIINKRILQIAVPSIISNITVPLLGLIDVTIVGHLGAAAYIGAIAVGGMLFNIIYWIFGFLRMGTSGMTSQAYGKHDLDEVARLLLRSVGVGLLIAIVLVALQYPIRKLAFTFIQTTEEVERLATLYFRICIWGAPAMLGLYGFAGWFIGMQDTRSPMYVAIFQNVVNVIVSLSLAIGLGMKMQGVALGTLIAQWTGLFASVYMLCRHVVRLGSVHISWKELLQRTELAHFFSLNRDIFFRTVCLVAVNFGFTAFGARQGDTVLAANTLLMTFFTLFSYVMDGFAFAGEALSGHAWGANDSQGLQAVIRRLIQWGTGLAFTATLLYALGGRLLVALLSNDQTVVMMADRFLPWACMIPLAGTLAFVLDGICIGLTLTRPMLLACFAASLLFFVVAWIAFSLILPSQAWTNHLLWLAFILYLLVRGVVISLLRRSALS